jgi:hypothetical protein
LTAPFVAESDPVVCAPVFGSSSHTPEMRASDSLDAENVEVLEEMAEPPAPGFRRAI